MVFYPDNKQTALNLSKNLFSNTKISFNSPTFAKEKVYFLSIWEFAVQFIKKGVSRLLLVVKKMHIHIKQLVYSKQLLASGPRMSSVSGERQLQKGGQRATAASRMIHDSQSGRLFLARC